MDVYDETEKNSKSKLMADGTVQDWQSLDSIGGPYHDETSTIPELRDQLRLFSGDNESAEKLKSTIRDMKRDAQLKRAHNESEASRTVGKMGTHFGDNDISLIERVREKEGRKHRAQSGNSTSYQSYSLPHEDNRYDSSRRRRIEPRHNWQDSPHDYRSPASMGHYDNNVPRPRDAQHHSPPQKHYDRVYPPQKRNARRPDPNDARAHMNHVPYIHGNYERKSRMDDFKDPSRVAHDYKSEYERNDVRSRMHPQEPSMLSQYGNANEHHHEPRKYPYNHESYSQRMQSPRPHQYETSPRRQQDLSPYEVTGSQFDERRDYHATEPQDVNNSNRELHFHHEPLRDARYQNRPEMNHRDHSEDIPSPGQSTRYHSRFDESSQRVGSYRPEVNQRKQSTEKAHLRKKSNPDVSISSESLHQYHPEKSEAQEHEWKQRQNSSTTPKSSKPTPFQLGEQPKSSQGIGRYRPEDDIADPILRNKLKQYRDKKQGRANAIQNAKKEFDKCGQQMGKDQNDVDDHVLDKMEKELDENDKKIQQLQSKQSSDSRNRKNASTAIIDLKFQNKMLQKKIDEYIHKLGKNPDKVKLKRQISNIRKQYKNNEEIIRNLEQQLDSEIRSVASSPAKAASSDIYYFTKEIEILENVNQNLVRKGCELMKQYVKLQRRHQGWKKPHALLGSSSTRKSDISEPSAKDQRRNRPPRLYTASKRETSSISLIPDGSINTKVDHSGESWRPIHGAALSSSSTFTNSDKPSLFPETTQGVLEAPTNSLFSEASSSTLSDYSSTLRDKGNRLKKEIAKIRRQYKENKRRVEELQQTPTESNKKEASRLELENIMLVEKIANLAKKYREVSGQMKERKQRIGR